MPRGVHGDSPGNSTSLVRVRLLGLFSIGLGEREAGPWQRPSAKRICELVFVSPGYRVGREAACVVLFANLGPAEASNSLSRALSLAHAALLPLGAEAARLLSANRTHIWVPQEIYVEVDLARHEAALRAAFDMAAGPYATASSLRRSKKTACCWRTSPTGIGPSAPGRPSRPPGKGRGCSLHAMFPRLGPLAAGRGRRSLAGLPGRKPGVPRGGFGLHAAARGSRQPPGSPEHVRKLPAGPGGTRSARFASARRSSAGHRRRRVGSDCRGCGAPHRTALPRLSKQERRLVHFFAEFSGPLGMRRGIDPEDLRDFVGGALAGVIAELEGLGGTVTSVYGAGLAALFGAPETHEDDPERAVRAAFRALSVSGTCGRATGAEVLSLRIGIETGLAVVGASGPVWARLRGGRGSRNHGCSAPVSGEAGSVSWALPLAQPRRQCSSGCLQRKFPRRRPLSRWSPPI